MAGKQFILSLIFCFSIVYGQKKNIEISVTVDTVLSGKMSIRALVPEKNKIWYAANEGRYGYFDFNGNVAFEKRIVFDSLKPEFRSMAETKSHVFILSITNPALLYKIDKKTAKAKSVYRESHPKVFYDSMKFWNNNEGIALGDPTEDCFSILITRDGGDSWTKTPCASLPKLVEGEAAFAASNTNVVVKNNDCWIVSGGKKARVFHSPDKGKSWEVFDTPIMQGNQMSGIYTADFYDEKIGFVAGGNYDQPDSNLGNKAITADGGKTWRLVAENEGFGYASCVQFVPGGKGKSLACVGATGLWYSSDSGRTWQKLLDDKTLYTLSFLDEETAFAAGKGKIVRIRFKK